MYCILKVTCPALRITCILVFSYVTLLLSILIFHYYHHLFLYYLGKTHSCCPALLTCLTTLHWQCGIEPESNNTKWSYPLINRGWSAFTLCICSVSFDWITGSSSTDESFWMMQFRSRAEKRNNTLVNLEKWIYFPNQPIRHWSNFWLEKEQQLTETNNSWTREQKWWFSWMP